MATNMAMDDEARTLKGKRPVAQHSHTQIGPMTFVLRSESEMDKSMYSVDGQQLLQAEDEPAAASIADTSFGVQSLEDVMQVSAESLSRTSSNESDGKRKRPGNPVHPKIYATGQRIVSSEQHADRSFLRRPSMSVPHLTPLELSPENAGTPGTPRTNSIKSFILSDDGASVASDTGSQAIQSSSSDEDIEVRISPAAEVPQTMLVMPSISVPQRRPFSDRGRRLGHLRYMVLGGCGLGKTSFIRNVLRLSEDIVHFDGMTSSTPSLSTATSQVSSLAPTTGITELQASTKPSSTWWSDFDNNRWRKNSVTDGVLERNIRLVDTPGIDSKAMAQRVLQEVDSWHKQGLHLDNLNDNQLLQVLSGKADFLLDAVVYLCSPDGDIAEDELHLLRSLSRQTTVIPVVAKSDLLTEDELQARKAVVLAALGAASIEIQPLSAPQAAITASSIHHISSHTHDGDIMDASTLMASSYLPPLYSSQLQDLVEKLFDPSTTQRLHHEATIKFITWRRQTRLQPVQQNKTLTHGYASYLRSSSPSSDASQRFESPYVLPQHERTVAPSRNIHIAKWARDLQRSLRREDTWRDDHSTHPTKGRLGGELAIIDPKDPLGVLYMTQSLGARGWLALQIFTGFGVLGAAAWWMTRGLLFWQTWSWSSNEGYFASLAIPAPTRSWLDSFRTI